MSDAIKRAVREHCATTSDHGSWVLVNASRSGLALKSTGHGVEALKNAFGDNEINFALLTLRCELQGIKDQPRHIWFHWKGPSTSGMAKVQGNQQIQNALDALSPNHGQIEVTSKRNFNEGVIMEKWGAGTGSHIID